MDGRQAQATRRPFVGRRVELEAIDETVAASRRGEPGIVWIAGAAGMGKSALLACAVDRAGPVTLLTATGDEAESALPYGLVDQLVAALPADLLAQYPLVGPARDPRADPMVVGADLLAALGAVRGDDPLLVVVDDVQWADDLSVRTLVFVLRRLRHDRVVVLLGVRTPDPGLLDGEDDAAVDPRWERMLGSVHGARRLPLTGLAPAELSELAAAIGRPLRSTGTAERLWARTRGHPLHARTLLEELAPEVLAATTTDVLPAPRSLAAVVLVRLSRASAAGQALVVAASVLGEPCALADAAALAASAGLDPIHDPAAALDEGVRVGLLTERGDRPVGAVGFVHPLLRAAVYGDQPPGRRRALHRAAAALVRGRAALPHRIAAASGPDPELAADLERLAADAAGESSPLDVADLWHAAAAVSVDPDDRERRTFHAVEVLLAAGEIGRAGALEGDVAAARPGPVRDGLLGRLALLRGALARARPLLDAAVRGADDRVRAIATADLALLSVLEGHPARAVELAAVCFADPANGPLVRQPAGFALILGLVAAGTGRTPVGSSTSPPAPRRPGPRSTPTRSSCGRSSPPRPTTTPPRGSTSARPCAWPGRGGRCAPPPSPRRTSRWSATGPGRPTASTRSSSPSRRRGTPGGLRRADGARARGGDARAARARRAGAGPPRGSSPPGRPGGARRSSPPRPARSSPSSRATRPACCGPSSRSCARRSRPGRRDRGPRPPGPAR